MKRHFAGIAGMLLQLSAIGCGPGILGGLDGGTATDSGSGSDAALPPPPGRQVLLFTGAGGGGPGTDLSVTAVRDTLQAAGISATIGDNLPTDFDTSYGVLWLMNPMAAVDSAVTTAAQALLACGGRVVLIMEHCKNGCWGDAADDNALLATLGSTIQLSGEGGAPLSSTSLELTVVPPLTDGVSSIVVYYTGSLTGGTILGRVPGGDGVIAYEQLQLGDVVVIADSSAFGYVLDQGDNERFVANLGVPLR